MSEFKKVECTCSHGYTCRNMQDPKCCAHNCDYNDLVDAFDALQDERNALAIQIEHLKLVCKNMYTQYEWAMQTQMFNKTSAMARDIIDKPPHECLAAHNAEVAKAAFIAGYDEGYDAGYNIAAVSTENHAEPGQLAEQYAAQLHANAKT